MKKETKINILDKTFHGILKAISLSYKDAADFCDFDSYTSENFYDGTVPFLKKPQKGASWELGFSECSLVPPDVLSYPHYLGGYISPDNNFKNLIEYVIDEMKARTIAVSDGSDRGISIFCTVDCIGITNADIRDIRKVNFLHLLIFY